LGALPDGALPAQHRWTTGLNSMSRVQKHMDVLSNEEDDQKSEL